MPMPVMKRTVDSSYEETLSRIADALKSEGFGVLTEIDVKQTLKKKLDTDFRRYKILGACNPTFAQRALSSSKNARKRSLAVCTRSASNPSSIPRP